MHNIGLYWRELRLNGHPTPTLPCSSSGVPWPSQLSVDGFILDTSATWQFKFSLRLPDFKKFSCSSPLDKRYPIAIWSSSLRLVLNPSRISFCILLLSSLGNKFETRNSSRYSESALLFLTNDLSDGPPAAKVMRPRLLHFSTWPMECIRFALIRKVLRGFVYLVLRTTCWPRVFWCSLFLLLPSINYHNTNNRDNTTQQQKKKKKNKNTTTII